jgi:hypothetical protein
MNPIPRAIELSLCAARLAVEDADLTNDINRERIGLAVGTGGGTQDLTELSLERMRAGERFIVAHGVSLARTRGGLRNRQRIRFAWRDSNLVKLRSQKLKSA